MKTKMRDTSLDAWKEIAFRLPKDRRTIYFAIANADHALSDYEIAQITKIPINEVPPRRGELCDAKDENGEPAPLIVSVGKRRSPNPRGNRQVHHWKRKGDPRLL